MKDFKNKVAVVTGAASGIGKALATKCVKEGMKVVLVDVEEEPLFELEASLKKSGAEVKAVRLDVSNVMQMETLANNTFKGFGAVHLLFNNAGVRTRCFLTTATLKDWQWVLNVNLWGVINGIRSFVPKMMEQDIECHVVNTCSGFGFIPGNSIYGVSKFGIINIPYNKLFF